MMISDEKINEIIEKNDIVDVISSYVELRNKSGRLWGLCPFHSEKTGSFSVQPSKQMYYCFGCHAGGGVIKFIMEYHHLPFQEACKMLADRSGIELEFQEDGGQAAREASHKKRLKEACRAAARHFMENFIGPQGQPGRDYVLGRGLKSDTIRRFGIGYALDGWDDAMNYLLETGFSVQELYEAGLVNKNETRNSYYDTYRNRVIFPIISEKDEVLGFGARVLDDSKPKYLNTGDTPIYNKRRHLYGLNLQKGSGLSHLIVVEGYMDVIGLYECGVENAVASLGTALTKEQAVLLKRFVPLVYIAYDGDSAGQHGMLRGLQILAEEGLDVRVIVFPDDLDPDEFVRQRGREAFEELKEHAYTLNEFTVVAKAREFDLANVNDRERFAEWGCAFVAGLKPIEQDRYYGMLSQMTGYARDVLMRQGSQTEPLKESEALSNVHRQERKVRKKADDRLSPMDQARKALLHASVLSMEAAEAAVIADTEHELFEEGPYRSLFTEIIAAYSQGETPDTAHILASLSNENTDVAAGVFMDDMGVGKEPGKYATDCILRIRSLQSAAMADELRSKLMDTTLSAQERQEILRRLQEMKRK